MKKLIVSSLVLFSVSSFAASVRITSFKYVRTSHDYQSPLAELCGKVTGSTTAPTFVKVKVDPGMNQPGSYNTLAGQDGNFCVAVITWTGRAEALLEGQAEPTEASIK